LCITFGLKCGITVFTCDPGNFLECGNLQWSLIGEIQEFVRCGPGCVTDRIKTIILEIGCGVCGV